MHLQGYTRRCILQMRLFSMKINVPVNHTDVIILVILAILFAAGIRIVIGFFRSPAHKDTQDRSEEKDGRQS